jgi:hypothetical protein
MARNPSPNSSQVHAGLLTQPCLRSGLESTSKPCSGSIRFTLKLNQTSVHSIHFIYLRPDYAEHIDFVLHRYLTLLQKLHHCGARDLLVINIPPVDRTPKILLLQPWQQRIYAAAIKRYNLQLKIAIDEWAALRTDVRLCSSLSYLSQSSPVSLILGTLPSPP